MSDFEEALAYRLKPLHRALCALVTVLDHGRRKHPDNDGFRAPAAFHIERARKHLQAIADGDRSEQHLEHAATRLLMAIAAERGG
jgi:hypothetical protein